MVASDQPASVTARIAVDDARAYWTFGRAVYDGPLRDEGTVNSVPLTGGTLAAIASDLDVPTAIALSTSDVFWIDEWQRWIMKAPKMGGAPARVTPCSTARHLKVDDEHVYWLDYDEDGPGVFKVPIDGGAVTRLAGAEGTFEAMALDETHVYWADQATSTTRVMRVSIDGGEPVVLHSAYGNLADLAVGPSGVYWTGGGLSRLPLEGGDPVTLADEPGVRHVALDSRNVYWTVVFPDSSAPGSIRKLALDSGSVSTVASDQSWLSALAASDASVCWLNFGGGHDSDTVVCREACEDGC